LFSSLVSRVGQPVARYKLEIGDDSTDEIIEFHNLGFGLSFDLKKNKIWLVGFELDTPSVRQGGQNPFPSNLHGGIIGSDGPDVVAKKFGFDPISRSKNGLREKYSIPPYIFDCKFEATDSPECRFALGKSPHDTTHLYAELGIKVTIPSSGIFRCFFCARKNLAYSLPCR
jgi:hypothetical protein